MRRWFHSPVSLLLCAAFLGVALHTPAARKGGKLSVAATEPDIEAIVRVVGGDQVSSFSLFHECILKKDLIVEPGALEKLVTADVVVWTGFFNESAAIKQSLDFLDPAQKAALKRPVWIDVSKRAHRINVPLSTCEGYVEVSFMYGDPFFWLNPKNGHIIANNVAEGLAEIRPAKKRYFLANAKAFNARLNKAIARWQKELEPLKDMRIFSAQCGWQNFSQIGGPTFAACKKTPGRLPSPDVLVDHIKKMKVRVILVDPNTPPKYARAFREKTDTTVIEVPSSIDRIKGAQTYEALFDNMVRALKKASTK